MVGDGSPEGTGWSHELGGAYTVFPGESVRSFLAKVCCMCGLSDVLCVHTLYLLAYVAECGMQQVP